MLKIAEYNTITGEKIDLKELEKYGLTYQQVGMDYAYAKYMLKGQHRECVIIWLDRELQVDSIELLDIVYDLIKDGLVIKVDE